MTAASPQPTPAARLSPRVHARVDDLTARWAAASLGSAPWSRANGENMWTAWRRLAALDPTLSRRVRSGIRNSPDDRPRLSAKRSPGGSSTRPPRSPSCLRTCSHCRGGRRSSGTPARRCRPHLARRDPRDARAVAPARRRHPSRAGCERRSSDRRHRPHRAVALALGVDATDGEARAALRPVLSLIAPPARLAVWQRPSRGASRASSPRRPPRCSARAHRSSGRSRRRSSASTRGRRASGGTSRPRAGSRPSASLASSPLPSRSGPPTGPPRSRRARCCSRLASRSPSRPCSAARSHAGSGNARPAWNGMPRSTP